MRVFNPEKELRKIQKGNKNKIIYGVIALLLIIAIGSSYALYQIRYNKRIIYTTVAPFTKRDVFLAVKVNGETTDAFPEKDSDYAFSGYECDGDATVTFDPDKWIASVNATGPDKCTIKFGAKNINYDTIRVNEDILVDETVDANLRFIGATPNNYIWFNCLKYEGLTNENAETDEYKCEKWRIIGLMNNMTIVDEATQEETTNQSLIKIIREDKIGSYSWDNKDTTTGAETDNGNNNWEEARLMKLLNPGYNEEKGGSLYWNSQDGECYTDKNNATEKCDFKETGLKNDDTKNMIENVKWNIGGLSSNGNKTEQFYINERGQYTPSGVQSTWNGRIALMYPSDYGYATNNEMTIRNECLATGLYDWNNVPYKAQCAQEDWLLDGTSYQWTLTPYYKTTNGAYYISNVGWLGCDWASTYIYRKLGVRPTLYLKSNVKIMSGEGSSENPYILSP